MHKIPLRLFYRNIEELIIDQKSEAAIPRAKYLLEKYPKNITVYQLLGKALLDKQEYDTANTVFETILHIDPDDFVSHIGISLIAENFGNLERALSSMRRAYELQPSNEKLQAEVKRLHELKDGAAPEHIRLTRGALLKMYSRSQLIEQAIAEARLGIHESPDRIDYKIHLAEMLSAFGKNEEAIEISLDILSELPYCQKPLFLLYKSVEDQEIHSESSLYKKRLTEIDPYFAFMNPETKSVNDIPDIAIMIDEIENPVDPIDNLATFIHDEWEKVTQTEDLDTMPTHNEDWESIIDDAVSSDKAGSPVKDSSYGEVINPGENSNPSDDTEIVPEKESGSIYSRKNKLRRKLIAGQKAKDESEKIPNWILENEKEEKPEGKDEKEFGIKPVENFVPHPIGNLQNETFEEDGMTDHHSPINPSVNDSDSVSLSKSWESQEGKKPFKDESFVQKDLDDTQKIKVIPTNPDDLFQQTFLSIEAKNFEFAFKCLDALFQEGLFSASLAEKLADACQKNPSIVELWLYLVRIYKKLDLEKKALEALMEAQNNISFQ